MSEEVLEIDSLDYSDEVRFGSRPAVTFYLGSNSYVNKKAATLLELKNEDLLALYYNAQRDKWFLINSPDKGVITRKGKDALFKFCDSKNIRRLFDHFGIKGKRASFVLGSQLESVSNPDIKALFINPKIFNEK